MPVRMTPLAVGHVSHWMPARISPLAIGPVSHWMPAIMSPLAIGPVSHWMPARITYSTCRRPRIPLDAGEDQTTRLWLDSTDIRREDAAEDFLTHRRPHIPQVAVGDSSTHLRPRHPLDTAIPTQDGPVSAELASPTQDLVTAAMMAGYAAPRTALKMSHRLVLS
jgi:hypothetical protein